VKEGHITRRATRGRATWVFTRWEKKEGCVVCRLSSSYISLGIPAIPDFLYRFDDYTCKRRQKKKLLRNKSIIS